MIYSRLRTLISILIVFCLAGAFLWGGSRLLDSVTGAAPPPPTATPQPVIEGPTAVPSPTRAQGRVTGKVKAAHRAPTPTPIPPTPVPSPTPKGPPKVFVTDADTPSPDAAKTTFHLGFSQIYCWVNNSALPPGAPTLSFSWYKDRTNTFLYQYPLRPSAGVYSGAWYYVPQVPDKYRCEVSANGQLVGVAHFTVAP